MDDIRDYMDDSRYDIRMSKVVMVGTAGGSTWMTACDSRRQDREN